MNAAKIIFFWDATITQLLLLCPSSNVYLAPAYPEGGLVTPDHSTSKYNMAISLQARSNSANDSYYLA